MGGLQAEGLRSLKAPEVSARCPIGEEHRRFVKAHPSQQSAVHLADLCLYHWSPRARRNGILRSGFVPGSNSLAREWKPPYICFSDNADLAWYLSGRIHPEIKDWDLWMVYPSQGIDRWELIFDTYPESGRHYIKEYRVYERIYKRHVQYIGSRSQP